MSKQTFIMLTFITFLSLMLVACQPTVTTQPFECTDEIGCVTIKPNDPIKLGTIQILSGDLGAAGKEHEQAIELTLAKRDGQLLGHPVTLQSEDSLCSVEGGANATLKIVADPQIIGIVGTLCSSAAQGATKIMSNAGLVMISGANNASSLTAVADQAGENWQPGYFRTSIRDSQIFEALAAFTTQKLGLNKGGIIYVSDRKEFVEYFDLFLNRFGGELVFDGPIDKEQTDLQPLIRLLVNSQTEVVYLSSIGADSASIVNLIAETPELAELVVLTDEAIITPDFLANTGEATTGIVFHETVFPEEKAIQDLKTDYEAEYGEPLFEFYDTVYDATDILLSAIETVAIQEADGTLHIGRQALRDAMYSTADHTGVIGKLTCDKFGDCGITPRFDFYQVEDSEGDIIDEIKTNVVYSYTPQR